MPGRTLAMLLVVYAVSYMDRQLVAILIEPIKKELAFSDAAAGLLYGFTFAVFFTLLGVPIAWLADRSNRTRIIVWSLALFSAMTAACAASTSFLNLLLARIGVGVGEAGTGPASQSILADLFPLERRGTAMAVFALGPNLGILLGFLFGGFIGERFGWRAPFLLAGIVGMALSLICAIVSREPVRTRHGSVANAGGTTIADAVRAVMQRKSLLHLFIGGTLLSTASTALVAWMPAFLMRAHDLRLSTTGALLALIFGVLGAAGTLLGGWLADRWGANAAAWRLRGIVIVQLVIAPVWVIVIATQDRTIAIIALLLAGTFIAYFLGPTFAMVQSLTRPRMRAVTASLLLLIANLVGIGLGPYLVGVLSDGWSGAYGAQSLRPALMTVVVPLILWAAVHYEIAARALAGDLQRTFATGDECDETVNTGPSVAGAHFR